MKLQVQMPIELNNNVYEVIYNYVFLNKISEVIVVDDFYKDGK